MDIVKAIKETWNIYKNNIITVLLAVLVMGIISAFSFGLLASVMTVGVMMMFVKAKRGQAMVFKDVFAGFSRFVPIFFGAILIALIIAAPFVISGFVTKYVPILGLVLILASLGIAVYLGVAWMFSLLLIYDKKLPIMQALSESKRIVTQNNFWMHLLLVVVIMLIASVGNILGAMGLPMWLVLAVNILATPLAWGSLAYVYEEESR